jgi:hypothetical protein
MTAFTVAEVDNGPGVSKRYGLSGRSTIDPRREPLRSLRLFV